MCPTADVVALRKNSSSRTNVAPPRVAVTIKATVEDEDSVNVPVR
jgi:hypothetical protein